MSPVKQTISWTTSAINLSNNEQPPCYIARHKPLCSHPVTRPLYPTNLSVAHCQSWLCLLMKLKVRPQGQSLHVYLLGGIASKVKTRVVSRVCRLVK